MFWTDWTCASIVTYGISLYVTTAVNIPIRSSNLVWLGIMMLFGVSVVPWLINNYGYDTQNKPNWYTILLTDVFGLLMLMLTVALGVEVYSFER